MFIQQTKGVDYESIKAEALSYEPMQRKVQLSDVDVDASGRLFIGGEPVRVHSEAIERDLFRILRLNPKFASRVEQLVGTEVKENLIKLIKNGLALSSVKKSEITLVGDPNSRMITNILPGTKDLISNNVALNLFEQLMNIDPDLVITGFSHFEDGTISINVKKNIQVTPETRAQRYLGEEFSPGFTFFNVPTKGVGVDNFLERLTCTNGMSMKFATDRLRLSSFTDRKTENFLKEFMMLRRGEFIPTFYPDRVERAMNTNASFHEILEAKNIMEKNSDIVMEKDFKTHLPEWEAVQHELARKGYDYTTCTDMQLKNYPTGYKIWDIVNHLTDFGSHNYGFNAKFATIQKEAGKFFGRKTFDTDNLLLLN